MLHISPAPITSAALDLDMRYSAWFSRIGAAVVVVRPDHYVFGTAADAGGLSAVLDDLASQLQIRRLSSLAGV